MRDLEEKCFHCGCTHRNTLGGLCQGCNRLKSELECRGERLSWAVGDHVCLKNNPHVGGYVRGYVASHVNGGPRIVQIEWGGRWPYPPMVSENMLRGLRAFKRNT